MASAPDRLEWALQEQRLRHQRAELRLARLQARHGLRRAQRDWKVTEQCSSRTVRQTRACRPGGRAAAGRCGIGGRLQLHSLPVLLPVHSQPVMRYE